MEERLFPRGSPAPDLSLNLRAGRASSNAAAPGEGSPAAARAPEGPSARSPGRGPGEAGEGGLRGLSPSRRLAGALALLFGGAMAFRLWSLSGGAPLGGYDERIYLAYAQGFARGGFPALRAFLARLPGDPVLSRGPLPLRVLYIAAAAAACRFPGASGYLPLVALSAISGLATLVAAWALFTRWLRPPVALAAVALTAVSPLATGMSARALQDSFFTFWIVATLVFFERTLAGGRRRDGWLLALCALGGLLTKETMALVYPVLALAAIGGRWRRPLIPLAAAALLALAVLAPLAGGVGPLFAIYRRSLAGMGTNDYVLHWQRGPWFRYLVDLLLLSPATMLLAGVGAVRGPPEEADRPGVARARLLTAAGLGVFSALFNMDVRFVIFADVLARALAAVGLDVLALRFFPRRRTAALAAFAALAVALDAAQWHRVFVAGRVYDPVTESLVAADGITR